MRKLCTRQYFIEQLSYNFVEKQCLLARCLWQRLLHDFGMDGIITTVNEKGEEEDRIIKVQVKSTEQDRRLKKSGKLYVDLSVRDLETWLNISDIVLLVLYIVSEDAAYFIDVAQYFKKDRKALEKVNKFVRVHFRESDLFDHKALRKIRITKNS